MNLLTQILSSPFANEFKLRLNPVDVAVGILYASSREVRVYNPHSKHGQYRRIPLEHFMVRLDRVEVPGTVSNMTLIAVNIRPTSR